MPRKASLIDSHPELALEWHQQRNNSPLEKADLKAIAWWRCKKDPRHEWRQHPGIRIKSPGCPYCTAQKYSLSARFPDIAREWNEELNGFPASEIKGKSRESFWWKCQHHTSHIWKAIVNDRTGIKKAGCPFCNGERTPVKNSIVENAPHLIKEWHPFRNPKLSPDQVSCGSQKKIWWQCLCKKEHEWQTTASKRAKGSACPFCKHKFVSDENRLTLLAPEIAAEFHPTKNQIIREKADTTYATTAYRFLSPSDRKKRRTRRLYASDLAVYSKQKVWWKCQARGHEWQAVVASRTGPGHNGCPYCSNHLVIAEENSLQAKFPDAAKQWHPTYNKSRSPSQFTPKSERTVCWICEKKNTYGRRQYCA
jgi:glutaredoxin